MNTNLIIALRNTVSTILLLIAFSPVAANAYTSTGSDGVFQPSSSVILDSTQQIFNFTSIFIPTGVTVSFSGLANAQPIQLLSIGDINIAGTLDISGYDLWLETSQAINITGSILGFGTTLYFHAGGNGDGSASTVCGLSDCSSFPPPIIDAGGVITIGDGGDITVCSTNCPIPSLVPEPSVGVLLLIGIGALFGMSKKRKPKYW